VPKSIVTPPPVINRAAPLCGAKDWMKSDAAPRLLDTNLPSPQDGFS